MCIAGNDIGDDGATAVGDALRGHTDLTSLDLYGELYVGVVLCRWWCLWSD